MDDNKFEKIQFVCVENKIKFLAINRLINRIAIRKNQI